MSYSIYADIPANLLEIYLSKKVVAIDTELNGLRLYRDEICLIQICDDMNNVCLVKPDKKIKPKNLEKLLADNDVIKIFHFALTDVAFLKTSLEINVTPFRCTKVMSKLIRTYTNGHGLKDISLELLGKDLNKGQQQTNWASSNLTKKQLEYAANDVIELVKIYQILDEMIESRPPLSTGKTIKELNIQAQATIPTLVDLIIHGYGVNDGGWDIALFSH